jgi:prophage tail gpP-like protein
VSLTPRTSIVSVYIGPTGRRVDVWDTIRVDLSMLEVATAWTLSFWWSNVGESAWRELTDPTTGVKCGQRITVTIDGDAVISGLVETMVRGDQENEEPKLVLSGRDELGVAVSADADPTITLRGRTIEDVIAALYDTVGIIADVSESIAQRVYTGRPVPRRGSWHAHARRTKTTRVSHPQVGEKVHQVVEKVARQLGYRVWTAPGIESGHTAVIVDTPRATGLPTMTLLRELTETGRVSERSNILWGRETTAIADVPTRVTVFADGQRGEKVSEKIAREVTNGTLFSEENAKRIDSNTPERPKYAKSRAASTRAGAENEASRILADANMRLRSYEAGVTGFRYGDAGLLWIPNSRVTVQDEIAGVSEVMLLVSASFSQSVAGAQTTSLRLLPDGAVSVIPVEEGAS